IARRPPADGAAVAMARMGGGGSGGRLRDARAARGPPRRRAPAPAAARARAPPGRPAFRPPGWCPALPPAPDPDRVYDLPALIDLALRANPQTRRSWEQARASAARLGIAESAWLPVLAVRAAGGTARIEDRTSAGPLYTFGPSITSLFTLQWTLIDF